MDMCQVVTTIMLADVLFDDRAEERRDIKNLVLPLVLCGSMGTTQQASGAPVAGPGGTPPTVVMDNNGSCQTLLLLALLRGRRHD
jgi:hypothetical protein